MNAKALAAILISLAATTSSKSDEFTPDWLSSAPPRRPPWDLFHQEFPSRPGEDFTDILFRVSRNPSDDALSNWRGRYQMTHQSNIEYARLQAKLDMPDLRELRDVPYLGRDWKTEHSLNLPVPSVESVFVFGNFDSTGDAYINQQVKMKGKTGLGWKWSPFSGGEMQLRTGPVVNYADVYNPVRPQERSQLSVELQAKINLLGPLQLQYSSEALPAFAPSDRHTVLQDLKIALPFGTNREFQFGAKYKWEDTLAPTPWMDRAQLYMGLKFER
jgi:hypothetical protein